MLMRDPFSPRQFYHSDPFATVFATEPFRTLATVPPVRARAPEPTLTTDEEGSYVYALELAGVPREKIEAKIERGVLTVRASHASACRQLHVDQALKLPRDADIDKATATHEDGVLTIAVPKREGDKTDAVLLPIRSPAPAAAALADAPGAEPEAENQAEASH